jgi:glycosyltransferase involved in cell wall biosynthesis
MKKIIIFSDKDFNSAPRILREISSLEKHFNLLLIGNNYTGNSHKFYQIYNFRSLRDKLFSKILTLFKINEIEPKYSKLKKFIIKEKVELLIIHDPKHITMAMNFKKELGIKIVFNAHEYYPLEFENDDTWLLKHGKHYSNLYKEILPQFDLIINVCESIREKCYTEFGFDSIVIPNAASRNDISPKFITDKKIKLIHHGVILPGRNIEKMISIVSQLGVEYQLDIMGVENSSAKNYFNTIKSLCENSKNCNLILPVDYKEIITRINNYDIGFYLLDPSNFNNFVALPNKIFEFLQAKLAIVVSPSPEMKKLVEKHTIGIASIDFSNESMIETIQSLDRMKINEFKKKCIIASKIENSEKYEVVLRTQIVSLFNS